MSFNCRSQDLVRPAKEPLYTLPRPSGRAATCLASCRLVLALSHSRGAENQPPISSARGYKVLPKAQRPIDLCRASDMVTGRRNRGGSAGRSASSLAAWPLLTNTQVRPLLWCTYIKYVGGTIGITDPCFGVNSKPWASEWIVFCFWSSTCSHVFHTTIVRLEKEPMMLLLYINT